MSIHITLSTITRCTNTHCIPPMAGELFMAPWCISREDNIG